jgi:hypothetical protein
VRAMQRLLARGVAATAILAGAMLVAAPLDAGAQVGHLPASSPFRDLDNRMQLSLLGGVMGTQRDPAGVAPTGGALVGLRYDFQITGPFVLAVSTGRVFGSERRVLDPTLPANRREVLVVSEPLSMVDVTAGLSLTGFRSWNRLVPVLSGGMGVVSDFRSATDVGGYNFGTTFAFVLGGGVRIVPRGGVSFRVDLVDRMYRIGYPETYYRPASDGTSIVEVGTPRARWTHNPALTLGISMPIAR